MPASRATPTHLKLVVFLLVLLCADVAIAQTAQATLSQQSPEPVPAQVFSANYWGSTYQVSATVGPADYIRNIRCEINVSCSGCSSVSASDDEDIYPELSPYDRRQRHGQLGVERHVAKGHLVSDVASQQHAVVAGGKITEQFSVLSNPCNLSIFQGDGAPVNGSGLFLDTYFSDVDLGCEAVADQWYRHSKVGASVIHEQRWRWDTTGVWKQ